MRSPFGLFRRYMYVPQALFPTTIRDSAISFLPSAFNVHRCIKSLVEIVHMYNSLDFPQFEKKLGNLKFFLYCIFNDILR